MNSIIGCDAHRRYSLFAVLDTTTLAVEKRRGNLLPGAILVFLSNFPERDSRRAGNSRQWPHPGHLGTINGSLMRSNS
jgi:hypothetical protein